MTIINLAAQPFTAEYFQASTGSLYALSTGNYFPQTGVSKGNMADRALISIETSTIYWKVNGSSPATACGHFLIAGDFLELDDPAQMLNFKFMNNGTATAYVHVTYFGG